MSAGPVPKPPPPLAPDAHKGDAGRVAILAGSAGDGGRAMPGAAVLSVRAALRGGAGLVTAVCFDPRVWTAIAHAVPEALLVELAGGEGAFGRLAFELESRGDDAARAVGPGLGRGTVVRTLVEAFLRAGPRPLVVDADGLNAFAGRPEDLHRVEGPLVVTPHPGEAARLLGRSVGPDDGARAEAARELARRCGGVCLLKGRGTVVTDGGDVWVNPTGGPALATGGTGDVLTGLLTALLAQVGADFAPLDAVRAAAWIHGRAGELAAEDVGLRAAIASDVVERLGAAERDLHARWGDR